MKIAIISDVLGEENNGTTITIKSLIENLKKRNHSVVVVSPYCTDEDGYHTLKTRNFYIFNKYLAKNGVELAKPDKDILRKVISECDLAHIVLPFKTGKVAIKIAKELNVPCTTAFHCQPENVSAHFGLKDFKPFNDFIYWRFLKKLYQHTQFIHCPTEFIANELRNHGYNMDLRVISNGVDPAYKCKEVEKPKVLKDKFCILFIARLSKEKRHDLLIEAVKQSKYKDKIQIIFAGRGPLENKLKKMGSCLPNPPIFGFYPKKKLVKIINYCDLYVHPSDIEIEAISCLEAITCGLVPIISDSNRSATNAFALNNKCKFKRGNPTSLKDKIEYFIEHPHELAKLKEDYKEYAKQFQIASCIDKMEEMFNDAIKFYTTF